MNTETTQKVVYTQIGKYSVSNELFLDLIFTEKCQCKCKFCIAKTPEYAEEDFERWKKNLYRTFDAFDVKNVIILGGESTIDKKFFEKLDILADVIKDKNVSNVILTTNGITLRSKSFLARVINSCITTINISYMHYDKKTNDSIFQTNNTLTNEELKAIYETLCENGMTMRLNVNVYKGNLDTVEEMQKYVESMAGICDEIKFSPLMPTDMFNTIPEVTEYTNKVSLSKEEIARLYDNLAKTCKVIAENSNVFGLVNYKEINLYGQSVILKYAQVEDTYDLDTVIPTLKLYPNGNLSNEWDYCKHIDLI